ncbi:ERCC4 domain-containing protein [Plebeiibacterium marinum]|uniref:Helix-hairpin-helix domain-containing protein n=1 Tax=Plebeiibacterium marinum TaxID=2992111 RepID=A0AAE3MDV6_9BACT|nr:ERCC4 domain-containing protein [Plebeiobacterium marinum]MCW3806133.1 helix-hairpin-helix domain-containing protein [Plebeiobacterium marinum]
MNYNQTNKALIIIDHREQRSGINKVLEDMGCKVEIDTLKSGDFIINNNIIIERKTKDDFVSTLIQNRLFVQCANLKKSCYNPMILIEGNPYNTTHQISREAIRGALVSVSMSWGIPINYSSSVEDSAKLLLLLAEQNIKSKDEYSRKGYRPKSLIRKQLYFLQGLPTIGPKSAKELLNHFGCLEKVITASTSELETIEGIGKEKAKRIKDFVTASK